MTTFPFFPNPAHGETVYSVLCRCSERSGLPERHLLNSFTGQLRRGNILSTIPGHIETLSANLPNGHSWHNAMDIILNHTGLPYFVYFLKAHDRQNWAKEVISKHNSQLSAMALGLLSYPCPPIPSHPRYCVQCAADQQLKYGFSFFRREHQLPGVLVCAEHSQVLSHGCKICGTYPLKWRGLSMPGTCYCETTTPLYVIDTLTDIEPLVWLARESAYLVNSDGTCREGVCTALKKFAVDKGFGRGLLIDYSKLAAGIESRFGAETFRHIGVNVWTDEKPSAWLCRLFYAETYARKGPSILFLLVIGTLFDSVESFEGSQLSTNSLSCTYPEEDTTTRADDDIKADWSDLKELLDNNYLLSELAKRYGVGLYTVAREIRRQGLRYPLSERMKKALGTKLEAIQNDLAAGHTKLEIKRRYLCSDELLILIEIDSPKIIELYRHNTRLKYKEKHRRALIDFISKNPDHSRSIIEQEMPASYEYFLRVDKAWFYEQVPKREKSKMTINSKPRACFTNWAQVDHEKAHELRLAFAELYGSSDKPIWLSKQGMLKRIGLFSKYRPAPQRFPLTTEVLNRNVETREEFIFRRLNWAIGIFAINNETITIDKLRLVVWLDSLTLKAHSQLIYELSQKHGVAVKSNCLLPV